MPLKLLLIPGILLLFLPLTAYTQDDPPLIVEEKAPEINLVSAAHHGPDSPVPDDNLPHRVIRNGKYGVVVNKTTVVVPFIYDALPEVPSSKMVATRNKHMALINLKNELLIPFYFPQLTLSKNGVFVFTMAPRGKYYLLDTLGKMVAPLAFDALTDLDDQRVLAVIGAPYGPKKVQVYNRFGKMEAEMPYTWLKPIGDGRYIAHKDSMFTLGTKTMVGIVDRQGKVLFPFHYTYFDWVKDNWARAVDHIHHVGGLLRLSDGKFHALPDDSGVVLMDDLGNLMTSKGSWSQGTERYGISDTLLHDIYPPVFNLIRHLPGGDYYWLNKNNKYGIGDRSGKMLTDFVFARPNPYIVKNEPDKWDGYHISYPGNDTLPLQILINDQTRLMGLFHHRKGWLIPDTCENITPVSPESFIVQAHGLIHYRYQYRMYNMDQQALTPVYDWMKPYFFQMAFAQKEETVVLLDKKGQVVRQLETDEMPEHIIRDGKYTFYTFRQKGKRALYDLRLQPLTPFLYKSINAYIPYEWLLKNNNLPGYGRWVAVGQLADDKKEVIDEFGKTIPMPE